MVESYSLIDFLKESPSARVRLTCQNQMALFTLIEEKYELTHKDLAQHLNVHVRTLSDWRRGRTTIPVGAMIELIQKFNISLPHNFTIVDKYWYTRVGAALGGMRTSNKYGGPHINEVYRKKQWRIWWEKSGRHKATHIGKRSEAKRLKASRKVAELIGIILGDGHIDTYQLTITLNSRDDADYAQYVSLLLAEITGVEPSITKRPNMNAVVIRLSRVAVSEELVKLGLKYGNKVKQQVDIPGWIKISPRFAKTCIRGLWDTDGCLYEEVHRKKNIEYRYPRLSFVSHSKPLLRSVFTILQKMDFSPKIRNNRSVNLETKADIVRYFHLIGSSNKKHLRRYSKFVN